MAQLEAEQAGDTSTRQRGAVSVRESVASHVVIT
jgi:hypothetical protein